MPRLKIVSWLALFAASLFYVLACSSAASKVVPLTVSGVPVIRADIEKIAQIYNQNPAKIIFTYNPGSIGFLKEQIEQGAPADIIISNDAKALDSLQAKDLILKETRQDFVANQMVLIVPKSNREVSSFLDLNGGKVKKVALADLDTTLAGSYTKEVLNFYNLLPAIKQKAVLGEYSTQLVGYVTSGQADAGIVYGSDALDSDLVKVVAVAPANAHRPLIYSVAALKNTRHPQAAKDFVQFLLSDRAQKLLKASGFLLLK